MAGLPQAWVVLEEAITYHAKQMVAWSIGREVREFRGGWQRNGVRSRIATRSILAIKGSGAGAHAHVPGLTNARLNALGPIARWYTLTPTTLPTGADPNNVLVQAVQHGQRGLLPPPMHQPPPPPPPLTWASARDKGWLLGVALTF